MIQIRTLRTAAHRARLALCAAAVGLSTLAAPTILQAQDPDAAVVAASVNSGENQPSREYLLKTAFVFNFARFTTWPPPSPDGPFYLCILGEDGFGTAARYLDGETLNQRNVDIRFHAIGDDLANCQLVYVARSLEDQLGVVLPPLHSHRILTVSDIPDFATRGGILGLKIVDNRIRFEANPAVAKKAGLRLSAQLLRHADVVGEDKTNETSG